MVQIGKRLKQQSANISLNLIPWILSFFAELFVWIISFLKEYHYFIVFSNFIGLFVVLLGLSGLNKLENDEQITNNRDKLLYKVKVIGLTTDRETLYERINKRVDIMVNNGLLEEVKHFYNLNIRTKPLLGGIGYKELYNYLDGNISLEKAIEDIKKDSRHYAKRQYTFFNNQMNIKWFNVDFNNFNNTINSVKKYIEKV